MSDEKRDKVVGLLLEEFLNRGLGTIRSMLVQAYMYGQQEAYHRGVKEGIRRAGEKKG